MLQYVPIIITALLGLLGLIAKTKKDDKPGYFNKLTPFGVIVCLLLLSSFITAIWLQNNKDRENEVQKMDAKNKAIIDAINQKRQFEIDSIGRETTINKLEQQKLDDSVGFKVTLGKLQNQKFADSIRFNVTQSNFGKQLTRQNQTLINIQKVIYSFKNVSCLFAIEISEAKSIKYEKYLKRVQLGIESLIPIFKEPYKAINGVSIVEWRDNRPNLFSIMRSSTLFPDSSGEEEEIYSLLNVKPILYFYKKSIGIKQTQFYFNYGGESSVEELNMVPSNLEYPDLTKTFDNAVENYYKLEYDRGKNTITIALGSPTLLEHLPPTGTIKSIPDLSQAKLFIQFPDINFLVKISLQDLQLHFDDLLLAFYPEEPKMYTHHNQTYFECNVGSKIKEVLLSWQKK